MEDSRFSTLKSSLSSVPAKALNSSCRIILSSNLDIKQLLTSKKGHARDYRGFAELMGFQYSETKKFEKFDEPTLKILEAWETHPDAMLDKLIDFLEEMERYDVIEAIIPAIEKDAINFKQNQGRLIKRASPIQDSEGFGGESTIARHDVITGVSSCPSLIYYGEKSPLITRHDVITGENTIYDVYVSYADKSKEDTLFVKKLADLLESPKIGLKLFIHGRDMLPGSSELEANIEMIKNRCKRMLIILTDSFIRSPQCAFQIRFAASLSIEQRERMLIPVCLSQCEIPSVLLTVSKIDLTNPNIYQWMWEKLILSLIPKGKYPQFLQMFSEFPEKTSVSANLESVSSNNQNNPVITYPETVKQVALPLDEIPHKSPVIEIPSSKISNEVISVTDVSEIPSFEASAPVNSVKDVSEVPSFEASAAVTLNVENISQQPKTSPKSRTKSVKNTFYSYLRKGRSSSSSSSILSNATSGFCSESTSSDNFKCVNE